MLPGADDTNDEGTVAGLAFAVLGAVALIFSLVTCMLKVPAATRDLLRYVQRLEALDREYVDIDLSRFNHLLTRTESGITDCQDLRFRFNQSFTAFKQTGLAVWQASITLSIALLRATSNEGHLPDAIKSPLQSLSLRNARVIELGAGLGVLSILVAALMQPAEVLATDGDAEAVLAASENLSQNLGDSSNVAVRQLRWGVDEDVKAAMRYGSGKNSYRRFDIVMASDVTYSPAPLDLLQSTILELVAPTGTVILAHRNRTKTIDPPIFTDLARYFKSHACCQVADETWAGLGGGAAMEEDCLQIHVFKNYTGPARAHET